MAEPDNLSDCVYMHLHKYLGYLEKSGNPGNQGIMSQFFLLVKYFDSGIRWKVIKIMRTNQALD